MSLFEFIAYGILRFLDRIIIKTKNIIFHVGLGLTTYNPWYLYLLLISSLLKLSTEVMQK